jgi:hypothetical protein
MSESDPSLSAHWQFYSERALQTHRGRVDDLAYGREELLWETLVVIESRSPFTDDCRQRLDRIPWNRAKKHRRLRLHLLQRGSLAADQKLRPVEVAGCSIEQVRSMLSPNEWEVEYRLATGQTYADVARDRGISPETLKVRAGRWRARIRRKVEGSHS